MCNISGRVQCCNGRQLNIKQKFYSQLKSTIFLCVQVQLSFMPEKIRVAVTSKEITPEELGLQKSSERKINTLSNESHLDTSRYSCEKETNGKALIDQLDQETLKEIASEGDFKLFKEAWTKALEANEEVRKMANECSADEWEPLSLNLHLSKALPPLPDYSEHETCYKCAVTESLILHVITWFKMLLNVATIQLFIDGCMFL